MVSVVRDRPDLTEQTAPADASAAPATPASTHSAPSRSLGTETAPDDGEPALARAPERVLMKGNEAIAEAAIQAGCDAYFGYPITPQAELLEWMARRMPELGRAFIQAESELGAINMALGAGATGARVLVSSSSPGISLMAEGMSYMAGSEVPMVLVNVMRGGPGLGSIGPSQSDYFQATKGHGHGDYRLPVLAPASIAEAMALMADAFELAERYRTPVIVLADGILGQAMEPVVPVFRTPERHESAWAVGSADGRPPRVVRSLILKPEALEVHNRHLQAKAHAIERREVRWDGERLEDAELAIVAYGTAARVARTAMQRAREAGLRVGILRPISLWPFPEDAVRELAGRVRGILVVELSGGQMVEDVRRVVEGRSAVTFHGRMGGMVPSPADVVTALRRLYAITAPRSATSSRSLPDPSPAAAEPDPFGLVEAAGLLDQAWAGEPDPLDLVETGAWTEWAAEHGASEAGAQRDPGAIRGSDATIEPDPLGLIERGLAATRAESEAMEPDPADLVTVDDWERFRRRCRESEPAGPDGDRVAEAGEGER